MQDGEPREDGPGHRAGEDRGPRERRRGHEHEQCAADLIVRSVVAEGLRLTGVGLAIGLALSLAVGRGVQSLLFGVRPTDVPTYAGVVALLAAASLVACYLPAQRAARIDPMQALREE